MNSDQINSYKYCIKRIRSFKFIAKVFLIFVILQIVYHFYDPLGLSSVTSLHSKTIFYQWTSNLYKGENEDPVSVVILRDESLKSINATWPVKASVHADILEGIKELKPRAVFVDIAFIDDRNDSTLQSELVPVIDDYLSTKTVSLNGSTLPIDLYFLAISPTKDLPKGVLQKIAKTNVKLVRGPLEDEKYPGLKYTVDPDIETQGQRCNKETEDTKSPRAVAFEIYRNLNIKGKDEFCIQDMEIVWRSYSNTGSNGPYRCIQQCDSYVLKIMQRIFPGFLNSWLSRLLHVPCLVEDSVRQFCPPIKTIDAGHFLASDYSTLEKYIEGKIVLYGGDLDAVADFVYPPTHKRIPGVFFNAMALDNLLTYGNDYIRHDKYDDSVFWLKKIDPIESFALITLILLLEISRIIYAYQENNDGSNRSNVKESRKSISILLLQSWNDTCRWLTFYYKPFLASLLIIALFVSLNFFYFRYSPFDFIGLYSLIGIRSIPFSTRAYDRFKLIFDKMCENLTDKKTKKGMLKWLYKKYKNLFKKNNRFKKVKKRK